MNQIPVKTIERLSLYRRILMDQSGKLNIFSHELAALANGTPAQGRRDLMIIGQEGSPRKGYNIAQLISGIGDILDAPDGQRIALVGIGNLGRAILQYFMGRRPKLSISAAFDIDPDRVGRVIAGCRCYHIDEIAKVVKDENITVGIITVPAEEAQAAANELITAGVRGIVNFAPVRLRAPDSVYLSGLDITTSIEKTAYFAKTNGINSR